MTWQSEKIYLSQEEPQPKQTLAKWLREDPNALLVADELATLIEVAEKLLSLRFDVLRTEGGPNTAKDLAFTEGDLRNAIIAIENAARQEGWNA